MSLTSGVRFVPSVTGMNALASSEGLEDALKEVAEEIASNARDLAPELSGDYKAGISVVAGEEDGESLARVNANDWKSGLIEFGTEDTPAFAPLRRAVESVGLDVEVNRA